MQNRFKSPVFWIGIISIIALSFKTFGIYEFSNDLTDATTNFVLSLLSAFGVINNPTNKRKI